MLLHPVPSEASSPPEFTFITLRIMSQEDNHPRLLPSRFINHTPDLSSYTADLAARWIQNFRTMSQELMIRVLPQRSLTAAGIQISPESIGRGSYGTVQKAHAGGLIAAVKFVNWGVARAAGGTPADRRHLERSVHATVSGHVNIIELYNYFEEGPWNIFVMEFAQGGDLFSYLEPDSGFTEDVAHGYFKQLMNGVNWIHAKGIAHRDIKPENIFLGQEGDLKIGDFGLASVFRLRGQTRHSVSKVGSGPYMAPEIFTCPRASELQQPPRPEELARYGYDPELADWWSVGIVGYVMLIGNTPWDQATSNDPYFQGYVQSNQQLFIQPDCQVSTDAVKFIEGFLRCDPTQRLTYENALSSPWYRRMSRYLSAAQDKVEESAKLAADMLSQMRIGTTTTSRVSNAEVATRVRDNKGIESLSSTQPDPVTVDLLFDTDLQPQPSQRPPMFATSQPNTRNIRHVRRQAADLNNLSLTQVTSSQPSALRTIESDDPTPPTNPHLADFLLAHCANRFYSADHIATIKIRVNDALHAVGIPSQNWIRTRSDRYLRRLRLRDRRGVLLKGDVWIRKPEFESAGSQEAREVAVQDEDVREVLFQRTGGDILEWRRLFRDVCIIAKEIILVPEQDEQAAQPGEEMEGESEMGEDLRLRTVREESVEPEDGDGEPEAMDLGDPGE